MSKSITVSGIVLKHFNLGESDRIFTVFSNELGKISVLVKGVRKITSRKSGSMEVGNNVKLFLFEGKNFYILSEIALLNSFSNIKANYSLIKYGYHVLELVDSLTAENQEDPVIYDLAVKVFKLLNKEPRQIYVRAFEVKLLTHLGYLSITDQNYIDQSVLGYHLVEEDSLEVLKQLNGMNLNQIKSLEINEKESGQIENFLTYRIESITEKKLRSKNFF